MHPELRQTNFHRLRDTTLIEDGEAKKKYVAEVYSSVSQRMRGEGNEVGVGSGIAEVKLEERHMFSEEFSVWHILENEVRGALVACLPGLDDSRNVEFVVLVCPSREVLHGEAFPELGPLVVLEIPNGAAGRDVARLLLHETVHVCMEYYGEVGERRVSCREVPGDVRELLVGIVERRLYKEGAGAVGQLGEPLQSAIPPGG